MPDSERTGAARHTGATEANGAAAVFGPAGRTAEIARPRHKHLSPQAPRCEQGPFSPDLTDAAVSWPGTISRLGALSWLCILSAWRMQSPDIPSCDDAAADDAVAATDVVPGIVMGMGTGIGMTMAALAPAAGKAASAVTTRAVTTVLSVCMLALNFGSGARKVK